MSNRRHFVCWAAAVVTAYGLIVSLLPGLAASCAYAADSVLRQRPNVIVIMADDLGYECLGCNGGESYQTPHSDQLARTVGNEGRYVRDHRWKLYGTGKSRRDIPFYKGGQLYDMLEDPLEEHPIKLGSNAEADTAHERLQAVFAARTWQ